jgi:hypothetical protein
MAFGTFSEFHSSHWSAFAKKHTHLMDLLIWILLGMLTLNFFNNLEQSRRVATLAHLLAPYQIERLMERLLQGYMRVLGEEDVARQRQIWDLLSDTERDLNQQFERLASSARQLDETQARISRLPVALPGFTRVVPAACFDLRAALAIHAQGLDCVISNVDARTRKDQAWTLSAELLLMQHTCHWYCKSKTVASARLLARHQTRYEQVLTAVSPETQAAYGRLVGGAAAVA